MASLDVPAYAQAIVSATAEGMVEIADSSGYFEGAVAWLSGGSSTENRKVVIQTIFSAVHVGVRFIADITDPKFDPESYPNRFDLSNVLLFSGGILSQPAQIIAVPSVTVDQILPGPGVELSPKTGRGRVKISVTSGTFPGFGNSMPQPVDPTMSDPGVINFAARIDHRHFHGNLPGGALHADVVPSGASGFMSGAQAAELSDDTSRIGIAEGEIATLNGTTAMLSGQVTALQSDVTAIEAGAFWVAAPTGLFPNEKDVSALPDGALLKNDAGAPAAALAGTDYEVPLTFAGTSHRVGNTVTSYAVIELASEAEKYTVGMTEDLLAQFSVDFDALVGFTSIACLLTAQTAQTGGASGVYYVRIGGTDDVTDGTIVATLNTTNSVFPVTPDQATGNSFARPSGSKIVKLTSNSSIAGEKARIKAFQILIGPV